MKFPLILLLAFPMFLSAHGDLDPVLHWDFSSRFLRDGKLVAQRGPDVPLKAKPEISTTAGHESLGFDSAATPLAVADVGRADVPLPKREFTATAWFSVDTPRKYGAVVSAAQDNGNEEQGWILGYDESRFYIALSTTGADDGNGLLTFVRSETKYEKGRLYQVAATYDGKTTRLFVNGKEEASSTEQSGDILYPKSAPLAVGGYRDVNEDNPHHGRIRSIRIWDTAAKPEWVAHDFGHLTELAEARPESAPQVEHQESVAKAKGGMEFTVSPYLQFGTTTTMTVMWESSVPSRGRVRWGPTTKGRSTVEGKDGKLIHEIQLTGLEPDTQYFYRAESEDADGELIRSEALTFQTAPEGDAPFAFAVISDTQSNPAVAGKVAQLAWGQRPHFLLHPGDLVGTGSRKGHWTGQFFPSMKPLIERVAFFPVLGNHEQNAKHYYDYMSLPTPEYYYRFTYGNAEFFMIDTNKKVGPESEQYQWLDESLGASKAEWKFVCHHHPPYSSDENDYGKLWETNQSRRGDLNARQLTALYDKHGVDIVWNGHIHSYERTWPIKSGKAIDDGGTVYMITGGGGGGLETPGPVRPFFQNTVRRGHHYSMVRVNGVKLEFFAYDLEGRLFDTFRLEGKKVRR